MKNKVCLVTGATGGIGKQTATALSSQGATVVVGGRDPLKCSQATREIQEITGNPKVDSLVADLSSQAECRRMVAEFQERYDRLDVLVNNAGAAFLKRQLSVDGIEKTFALNHLGYFLVTNLLLDVLVASAPARIVNVSSGAYFGRHLDFEDLELHQWYNALKAYGLSKLSNILFTYELDRRLVGIGVTANAVNPGMVVTNIWRNIGPVIGPIISWWVSRNAQTPEEGAQGVIYLASSPEVAGVSGKYYNKIVQMESDPVTYDRETARRLWEVSAAMTRLEV